MASVKGCGRCDQVKTDDKRTSAIRRMFSLRSFSENARSLLRPKRILSPVSWVSIHCFCPKSSRNPENNVSPQYKKSPLLLLRRETITASNRDACSDIANHYTLLHMRHAMEKKKNKKQADKRSHAYHPICTQRDHDVTDAAPTLKRWSISPTPTSP